MPIAYKSFLLHLFSSFELFWIVFLTIKMWDLTLNLHHYPPRHNVFFFKFGYFYNLIFSDDFSSKFYKYSFRIFSQFICWLYRRVKHGCLESYTNCKRIRVPIAMKFHGCTWAHSFLYILYLIPSKWLFTIKP